MVSYVPVSMIAHKAGRVEMYTQVCSTLGVTDTLYVRVGDSVIMPDGIQTTTRRPKSPVSDLCNFCHAGGVQ
jgi:hypothetical protein